MTLYILVVDIFSIFSLKIINMVYHYFHDCVIAALINVLLS